MKKTIILLSVVLVVASCARLPNLTPTVSDRILGGKNACNRQFLQEKWRMVHFIEASLNGRPMGGFYGVTVISPGSQNIHSVLMTLEGFVVFDAQADVTPVVNRAVAPFDTRSFAEGLFEDIRLIFLRPNAARVEFGVLSNSSNACRYWQPDASVIDMVREGNNRWTLNQYRPNQTLARKVAIHPCDRSADPADGRLPCTITVTAYQPRYKLELKLLEAEKIVSEEK